MNEFKKFAGNCRELVRKKIFIYFRSGFEFEICIKAVESFRCLQQHVSLFHQNGEASASRRPQVLLVREVPVKGTKLERKLRFNFLDSSEYIFSNRSLKCVAGIVADEGYFQFQEKELLWMHLQKILQSCVSRPGQRARTMRWYEFQNECSFFLQISAISIRIYIYIILYIYYIYYIVYYISYFEIQFSFFQHEVFTHKFLCTIRLS